MPKRKDIVYHSTPKVIHSTRKQPTLTKKKPKEGKEPPSYYNPNTNSYNNSMEHTPQTAKRRQADEILTRAKRNLKAMKSPHYNRQHTDIYKDHKRRSPATLDREGEWRPPIKR